jgi:hypothetical protein
MCVAVACAQGALANGSHHTSAAGHQVFCSGPLDDFVNQVQHVESEADIVKSYARYRSLVAEAADVQAHVPWRKVTGVCLTGVGAPAKAALRLYTSVAARWKACSAGNTCNSASFKAYRTKTLATAAKYVNGAYNRLD